MTVIVVTAQDYEELLRGISKHAEDHPQLADRSRWTVDDGEDGLSLRAIAEIGPARVPAEEIAEQAQPRIAPEELAATREALRPPEPEPLSRRRYAPHRARPVPRIADQPDDTEPKPPPIPEWFPTERYFDRRMDALRSEVAALRRRVDQLDGRVSIDDVHESFDALIAEPVR